MTIKSDLIEDLLGVLNFHTISLGEFWHLKNDLARQASWLFNDFFTTITVLVSPLVQEITAPYYDLEHTPSDNMEPLTGAILYTRLTAVNELHMGEGEVAHLAIKLPLPLPVDGHLGHLHNVPNL